MRSSSSIVFAMVGALLAVRSHAQQWQQPTNVATNVLWLNTFEHAVDFDQNGKPDVVFASTPGIGILHDVDLAQASFTWSPLWSLAPGAHISLHHVGDVDGDAIPDLIVFGPVFVAPRHYYIVPGIGGGQLGAPVMIPTPLNSPNRVELLDVDGDGDLDMLTVDPGPNNLWDLYVWTQDVTGWTLAHTEPIGISHEEFGVGDFDGDGRDDAIFYFGYPLYQHRILWGDPQSLGTVTIPFLGPHLTRFASGADLNGDGRDDVVVAGSHGKLEVYFGAPGGLVPGPVLAAGLSGNYRPRIADMDVDGRADIIASGAPGTLVYRGDGVGGFSSSPQVVPVANFSQLVDLDGDADLDILSGGASAPLLRVENRALYGAPCLGTNGEPRLDIGAATPGNPAFSLGISNAPPGALAQFVIAVAGSPGPCGPQFDPAAVLLPAYGAPLFGLVIGAGGSAQVPVPLPVGLPIVPFYLQGIVVDPNGAVQLPGLSLSATRGRVVELF